MEKEPPQELLGGYRHQLLLTVMRIIFPAKRDLAICESHDPVVGDSNAMCIARQIVQDMVRPAERRFSINDPVVSIERTKERTKSWCLSQSISECLERSALLFGMLALNRPRTYLGRHG